jgi:hypothetical protein
MPPPRNPANQLRRGYESDISDLRPVFPRETARFFKKRLFLPTIYVNKLRAAPACEPLSVSAFCEENCFPIGKSSQVPPGPRQDFFERQAKPSYDHNLRLNSRQPMLDYLLLIMRQTPVPIAPLELPSQFLFYGVFDY